MKLGLKNVLIFIVEVMFVYATFLLCQMGELLMAHKSLGHLDFLKNLDVIVLMSLGFAYRMHIRTLTLKNTAYNLDLTFRVFMYHKLEVWDDHGTQKIYGPKKTRKSFSLQTISLEKMGDELRLVGPWYLVKGVKNATEGYDVPPPVTGEENHLV